jgi:hypothetical protein
MAVDAKMQTFTVRAESKKGQVAERHFHVRSPRKTWAVEAR